MLSVKELEALIQQDESDRVEFTVSDKNTDKVREAICAFANDLPEHRAPGVFFAGLTDDGKCANLPITDKLLRKLAELGDMQPPPSIQVGKVNLLGGEVAVVQVEPSYSTPVYYKGVCYVRVGPRQNKATAEDVRILMEKRAANSRRFFDMQAVQGASVEGDVDVDAFRKEYLPYAVPPEVVEANGRPPQEQMKALRLADASHIPTVAAILMLGSDPQAHFPCAYIQLVRYDGGSVTDNIIYEERLYGTLPQQLRGLSTLLKINIKTALDTSGVTHLEKPDYPYEALRELAHNAVLHRDYSITTTPIHIRWFNDRIEIVSPGTVSGGMRKEDFGSPLATSYRNPTIAGALKNLGFVQSFGRGIALAREALEKNGNPPPEFVAQDNRTLVKIMEA